MDLSMIFYLLLLDVFDKERCKMELSNSPYYILNCILGKPLWTYLEAISWYLTLQKSNKSITISPIVWSYRHRLPSLAMDIIQNLDIIHSTSLAFDKEILTVLLCSLQKHFLRSENREITTRVRHRMDLIIAKSMWAVKYHFCKVVTWR